MLSKAHAKLHRLFHMEEGEFKHILLRRLWRSRARFASFGGRYVRPRQYTRHDMPKQTFFFQKHDIPAIREVYNSGFILEKDTILTKAQLTRKRQFEIFDQHYIFDKEIDWHLDPISNQPWPDLFFQDIVYSGKERLGDVKFPWELSRHQYLIPLGQAYLLTGEDGYAEECISLILSWIAANPPYRGVNWISALEVGIRLINWVWAYHMISDYHGLSQAFMAEFLSSVEIQANYLYRNLTFGKYANNHLIGEAAGLVLTGLYFPTLKGAGHWVEKGKTVLESETLKQIHTDGGGAEQASSYLRFILEFLIIAFRSLQIHGQHVSPSALQRVEMAFQFLMFVMFPDGRTPRIGDSDDARAIFIGSREYWNFQGLLSVAAVLFKRGDFKFASGGISEELIWYCGGEGLKTFRQIDAYQPSTASQFFPASGYAVFRDSWDVHANYSLLDCGPIGYRSAGHGHADALSFQLCSYGTPIIVDRGTYAYNREPELRNYFRGTQAHNTLTIDGSDQARITDRMGWDRFPEIRCDHFYSASSFDAVTASMRNHNSSAGKVTHLRSLIFNKANSYYILIDRLKSNENHDYRLNFHFDPSAHLKIEDAGAFCQNRDRELWLQVAGAVPGGNDIRVSGQLATSYYSEHYGQLQESPYLSFSCNPYSDLVIATLLIPCRSSDQGEAWVKKKIELYAYKEGAAVEIESNQLRHTWLIAYGDERVRHKSIDFIGKLLWLDFSNSAPVMHYCSGRYCSVNRKVMLETQVPFDGLRPSTHRGELHNA